MALIIESYMKELAEHLAAQVGDNYVSVLFKANVNGIANWSCYTHNSGKHTDGPTFAEASRQQCDNAANAAALRGAAAELLAKAEALEGSAK